MTNKTIDDKSAVTNLADDDTIPNWDTSSGQQVKITALNMRSYMQTGLSTTYVKADGTTVLTGDWDIGVGRKIQAEQIIARSNAGLKLYEDGGKGIFVQDSTGYIGVGHNSPLRMLHVIDTTYVGGWIAGKLASAPVSLATISNHTGALILTEETNQVGLHIGVVSSGNYDTYLQARWMTASSPASNILLNPLGGLLGVGTITPVGKITVVETGTGTTRGFMSSQHNAGAQGAMIKWRKSRGTEVSPSAVTNTDYLGVFQPQGYDGSTYRDAGLVGFIVDGSVSSGNVPTAFVISTTTTNGDGTERVRVSSTGQVGLGVTPSYPLHVYNATSGRIYIDSDFTTGTCVLSFASGRDLWRPANSNDLHIGSFAGPTPQWVMTSSGLCAIGNQTSPDSLLHVHSATAGSVTAVSGTVLTVESNGNCYISLLAPSASLSGIYFGSPTRNDGAQITWDRANDKLLLYKAGAARVQLSGNSWEPVSDSGQSLGQSGQRWSAVWSANGTIQTSDARMKQSVTPSNLGLDFINALNPIRWTWNDAQYGRIHHGLAAQQVKEVLDVLGAGDFGGYVYDEPTDIHSLRYSEFVAPLINAIQELTNRLELLEARN